MNEIILMIFALMAGLALGILFFGGLWVTVKKAVTSKIPAIWFFISLLVRLSITLIGFYYISLGSWQRLLIGVVGFIMARYIVLHLTKSIEDKQIQVKKEVYHET